MRAILLTTILIIIATAACAAPARSRLAEPAPDFTLRDTEGREVSLHALVSHGPVILAFFPHAFTYG
jgi:hypothetical protein